MFTNLLVFLFLFVVTTAQESLTPLFLQPPPGLQLERIAEVVEGHEDLYLASEYPYITAYGYVWVGVLSSTGSTNLEGAYFEWSGVFISATHDQHGALAHVASVREFMGVIEVRVSLANGEEITLKAWLPIKTGCWTNTPWYEAFPEVDEFGEEWPYMELMWNPAGGLITYLKDSEWCAEIHLWGGTNSCESFRGFGTEPGPPEFCGEIPSKYQTNNITIVQDGDGIIQYYAQGRSRRFTPESVQPPKRETRPNLP
eukprot:Gregarina_sp_Pseudo_9__2368@NODE_2674_length_914_cov_79_908571_g2120_i1_p1_GENE_NODE_2674_length_914_cov_79_908571_g2120_i1NODE_2674_length_914_cov_79_908571_g2120_i1_p1_ORF_typecomplete_len256_score4_65_NODE_2674_length_914_cov_79_908571_g2120_i166833